MGVQYVSVFDWLSDWLTDRVYKTWRQIEVHLSHMIPSLWFTIIMVWSYLVQTYGTRAKFMVWDSGTSLFSEELGCVCHEWLTELTNLLSPHYADLFRVANRPEFFGTVPNSAAVSRVLCSERLSSGQANVPNFHCAKSNVNKIRISGFYRATQSARYLL